MYIYIYICLILVSIQSVCVLVGAFAPFTFKVIIDIYVPIAIFLIHWADFVDFFSFCCIS